MKNFEDLKNNSVIPLVANTNDAAQCKTIIDSYTYAVQVKTLADLQNLLELNCSVNENLNVEDFHQLIVSLMETYDQLEEENFKRNVPLPD